MVGVGFQLWGKLKAKILFQLLRMKVTCYAVISNFVPIL